MADMLALSDFSNNIHCGTCITKREMVAFDIIVFQVRVDEQRIAVNSKASTSTFFLKA